MLKSFLLCVAIMVICLHGAIPQAAAEPAGKVYTVPAQVYPQTFGNSADPEGTTATANLFVPSHFEDAGTISITASTPGFSNLMSLNRSDVPDSLGFLFGDSPVILFRITRNRGMDYNKPALSAAALAYDKQKPKLTHRLFQFQNADGDAITSGDLTVDFRNNNGSASIKVPIGPGGIVDVPAIWEDVNLSPPYSLNSSNVGYGLTFKNANQGYTGYSRLYGTTTPTLVMIPEATAGNSSGTLTYEATVFNPDGSPARGFTAILPGDHSPTYYPGHLNLNDENVVVLQSVTPYRDGGLSFALSEHAIGRKPGAVEEVVLYENDKKLFRKTNAHLKANAANSVTLPQRLSLAAMLVDENGEPVKLDWKMWGPTIYRLQDGEIGTDQDNIGLSGNQIPTPQFELNDLPVPGHYLIKFKEKNYGPIDIGNTSPSEVLKFTEEKPNGRFLGRVLNEEGRPLERAVVLYLANYYNSRNDLESASTWMQSMTDIPPDLFDDLKTSFPELLAVQTTDSYGSYDFQRNAGGEDSKAVAVIAPGRLGAYIANMKTKQEVPLSQDVALPDVVAPVTTKVTGIVNAPAMVPHDQKPGELTPMWNDSYSVGFFGTNNWYGQYTAEGTTWQYLYEDQIFAFGKPFNFQVPVGTTFSLYARPRTDRLRLSLQLWKETPRSQGANDDLGSVTLRALQPFRLHLEYHDGTPAAGLQLSALYGTEGHSENGRYLRPVTDSNGEYLLWGDEGLAPELRVEIPYTSGARTGFIAPQNRIERFKIQKLDMSTSIPILNLRLGEKFKKLGEVNR